MTLTGLEVALLGGMIATASTVGGMLLKGWMSGNQCSTCGIDSLRAEIKTQSKMIRLLAEKAGVTVREQLEIEQTMIHEMD